MNTRSYIRYGADLSTKNYFRCRRDFLMLPGVREVRNGPYRFALPPGPEQDWFADHFAEVDAMIRNGVRLKSSVESSASVWTLPGGKKVFIKHNGNRGPAFTVKYFFIPARVFRAALAAQRVEEAGVLTPHVFAVGEKRRAGILLAGYLVTEAVDDACDLMTYVIRRPDAPAGMPEIIREAARIAAALHDHGFYHGDLKLINLYRAGDNAPCGVWDLDSARIFPNGVPYVMAVHELGRILSSIVIFAERNPAFPDDFFNLNRIAKELLDAYSDASAACKPMVSEVVDEAVARWLNRRKLRFDYRGQHA